MAMFRADDTQYAGGPKFNGPGSYQHNNVNSKQNLDWRGIPMTPTNYNYDGQGAKFKQQAIDNFNNKYYNNTPSGGGGSSSVDTSYIDALLAQINGAWDAQKNYIDAQYNEGIKKISDAYDERFRKQQALYNRNRRDIQKAGRFGGMNGAIIAGLTNAGNTNNNAVTQIGKDKANSMSELRTGYLGNLANLERDKNNFNLQLYKQYL